MNVSGTVANQSTTGYRNVVVWAAVFDGNARVLRVGVANAVPDDLDPGETAAFQVIFDDPAPATAAIARAWAEGEPD
jgi:hypothetical protein